MKRVISIICILIFALTMLAGCELKSNKEESFAIVTSFYPMYILTKNVVGDVKGVAVNNMTDKIVGCIHNYTLKASDLVKLEEADVFISNGLEIENFTPKIVETYPDIKVVVASENIDNLIKDEDETNAHIWLSIDKYLMELQNIKNDLVKADNNHEKEYEANAENYKQLLENLKDKIKKKNLEKKKCVSFSESLAYLEEDFNLEILTIETDHEQNGLSAEKVSSIIDYIKTNNIKSILVDNNTAQNNAKTVAAETGAKIYVMNSGLSGEDSNDSYIKAMEENLELVESME